MQQADQHAADISQALCLGDSGVICLFGGGGKTSLMFSLARQLEKMHKKVLTTTTTKIFYPDSKQAVHTLICNTAGQLINTIRTAVTHPVHICAGSSHDPKSGKLSGFSADEIGQIQSAALFDWIIIEADGARGKPIKASADHEPVFPDICTHLVLVAGLDAVNTPLDDAHVHRYELFSKNTGLPVGKALTPEAITRALNIEMNKAAGRCRASRRLIFLNKADSSADVQNGIQISHMLMSNPRIDAVTVAALQPAATVFTVSLPPQKHL
jgi:probable selenium-dependent hydroxylase accessory protein YqeC